MKAEDKQREFEETLDLIYEELEKAMQPNPGAAPLHAVTETGSRPAFRFMSTILLPGVVRPELQ